MPRITFQFDTEHPVEIFATSGSTLMEAAVAENIPGIEGECGGACACGTCHVIVAENWQKAVGTADDYEQEMLETLEGHSSASRLACQIAVNDDLDGLVVTVVPSTL